MLMILRWKNDENDINIGGKEHQQQKTKSLLCEVSSLKNAEHLTSKQTIYSMYV